jgi:uncharacterized membrane protein YeaQ/YmgE (transglycosylase-associated protein family)
MEILVGVLVVIALFVLGWIVIGLVAKLVWWLLLGIVIGALARLVLPGEQRIGVLATALYGAGGALLGGLVARKILHTGSLLQFVISIAIAAALVALFAGVSTTRRAA